MKVRMDKQNKTFLGSMITAAAAILLSSIFVIAIIKNSTEYEENTYNLSELNNGIYAIYYNVHSSIPADNYEVVTVNCNNSICTFKGHVYINYTEDNHYITYQNYKIVNADKIYLYVPTGSVEYQSGVTIK